MWSGEKGLGGRKGQLVFVNGNERTTCQENQETVKKWLGGLLEGKPYWGQKKGRSLRVKTLSITPKA